MAVQIEFLKSIPYFSGLSLTELGAIRLSQLQPQHIQAYYANALTQGRADGKGGIFQIAAEDIFVTKRLQLEPLGL